MAVNAVPSSRNFEHRFFAFAAALFVIGILIGFGPTFYVKPLFPSPPIARPIIWVHAAAMSAWVIMFVAQVYFISSKRIKLHQKLGLVGIFLAPIIVVTGMMVAIAAAKFGTASTPPDIPPLQFMIVPFGDVFVFAILFAAAVYYRKQAANHKRLILLTIINFLPPAVARFPGGLTNSFGPLWFYGFPTVLTIVLIALDTWRNGKVNRVFLFGGIFLILGMWVRLGLMSTPAWLNFATWITS